MLMILCCIISLVLLMTWKEKLNADVQKVGDLLKDHQLGGVLKTSDT